MCRSLTLFNNRIELKIMCRMTVKNLSGTTKGNLKKSILLFYLYSFVKKK